MTVTALASSSKGNSYVVTAADGTRLMIDCGLGPRELRKRTVEKGLEYGPFAALLITHDHTDHISGVDSLLEKFPETQVFANLMTADAAAARLGIDAGAFCCFENGEEFEVGPFTVHPFSVPHDTCDPVGYLVRADGETYFHATDLGTPLDSIGLKLAEADIATLESNHDPVMLHESGRHVSLIRRISGPRGHLSNYEAAELVERFAKPRLKRLMLAHLSHDCNAPHLAERTMRATLERIGRTDIALEVLE